MLCGSSAPHVPYGGERKWAGEVRGCLPCQALPYPARGTWLWRGGRVAGTSHLTIAPITAGGTVCALQSLQLAWSAASLHSSRFPLLPLRAAWAAQGWGMRPGAWLSIHPLPIQGPDLLACWGGGGSQEGYELSSLPRLLCSQPEASPSLCCVLTQGCRLRPGRSPVM